MVEKVVRVNDAENRLRLALDATSDAADVILRYYRSQTLGVESKADDSPVTAADRAAEELLRSRIIELFPDDAVLGEEFDDVAGTSGFRWILDPIDGTKPFIFGVPLFGTLVGIEHHGKMVAGVCRFPAVDEVMWGSADGGAWWQVGDAAAQPARVSSCSRLGDARLMLTDPAHAAQIGRGMVFPDLFSDVRMARGWGDCFGHMMVATGRAEIAIDPKMSPWDIAALIPIVEAAGGTCCSWSGARDIFGGDGVSVVPGLKDEVLARLAGAPAATD